MKTYKIEYSSAALLNLKEILYSIKLNCGNDTAYKTRKQIAEKIELLKTNPYLGVRPMYKILFENNYRILSAKKCIIVYKIFSAENKIIIYDIFNQKQDYLNVFNNYYN